jgi:hypothetical protein
MNSFTPLNEDTIRKTLEGKIMVTKTIISIMILVFICSSLVQAQRGIDGEILCETTNASGATYKFEIKPVSGKTSWCQDDGDWYIVTSTSTQSLEITGDECYDNSYVFDVCYAEPLNPDFWLTLNEFTIYKKIYGYYWDEKISFYIDYRDCNYGLGGPSGGGSRDITFIIDGSDYKTYYQGGTGDNECDLEDYTEVTDGDTLKIWVVNDFTGSHDISCMCATPSLISVTNYNNNPKVLWSHDDDPNGSYSYEVWRLLTQMQHPRFGTWYLINTISDTSYVDREIYIGDGSGGNAFYKVRAKIDDLISGYSDYDYIAYEYIQKPVVQNPDIIKVSEFKLYTNYPNPFNPSTKISFDILEQSPVELAVYDIQGKKVVTLVNETLESGNYSVEFNAGNLPSGTYLYKIVAGEFSDSKKMMLVK